MEKRCVTPLLRITFLVLFCLALASVIAYAQADPDAGILPFSTQVRGPFDSIDLATGSITVLIPVRTRAGKPPFSFALVGNSHAWSSGSSWLIAPMFAGRVLSAGSGVQFSYLVSGGGHGNVCGVGCLYDFVATDPTGAAHSFLNFECDTPPCTGTTSDGSGYTAYVTSIGSNAQVTFYDKGGNAWTKSTTGSTTTITMTDPDNVTMQSVQNGTTTTYTDSLGMTAITAVSGGGSGGSDKYTYQGGNGNSQTFQVNYSQFTQVTNFACAGIHDIAGGDLWFPTQIVTPIGNFSISYERPTGYSGNGAYGPYATGRISKVTFPMGGYVSYAYSGGNNGINCASQAIPTLTRNPLR